MSTSEQGKTKLTEEQIRLIASGLYYIANTDGIDAREIVIIEEFLTDSGSPATFDEITQIEFEPVEAAKVFNTKFMRRVFIKAAMLLIEADKRVTSEERDTIMSLADAFGMDKEEVDEIKAFIEEQDALIIRKES